MSDISSTIGTVAGIAGGTNPVGLGIEAAAGVGELIAGAINSGKAKREAAQLEKTRPKYNISPYAAQEVALNESELGKGADTVEQQGVDKDLSNSLSAILKSGGSVNSVGQLFDNSQDARTKLASLKEGIRLNQISNLTSAWRNYSDQTDKQFGYNVDAPYKDKAQAVAAARQGSQGQIWGGVNAIGTAGMQYSKEKNDANTYNNYLNPPQGNNPTYSAPNRISGSVQKLPTDQPTTEYDQLQQNSYNPNYTPPMPTSNNWDRWRTI